MLIEQFLKIFWILIAAILGSNAMWLFYIGGIEDEIDALYKLIKCQPLSGADKKKINKIARRKKANGNNTYDFRQATRQGKAEIYEKWHILHTPKDGAL
ncbi:MAG: hypothetical protein LBD41_00480 [Clostridiales Family XIII bacterium]|jgi:hypothetical protein|nr:hypothetical protein [Clostridiales Family XIII bacterium]